MPLIDIDKLRVTRNHSPICQVSRLTIEQGDRVAVLGNNGSGKTTLLRVLAGLEREYEGCFQTALNRTARVYVDQNPYLFRGTVLFNATYGLRAHGLNGAKAQVKATHWLEKLGIRALADARVNRLSGGERRRVALARAMAIESKLLLLDEPFSEMDTKGADSIQQAMEALPNTTIVLASPTSLPEGLCNRVCQIDKASND